MWMTMAHWQALRWQDEIGTPVCITVDLTLEDDTVTIRNRDNGEQERVKIEGLPSLAPTITIESRWRVVRYGHKPIYDPVPAPNN